MEETVTTTVETSQEQTTPEVTETSQPEENQTIEEVTQEPAEVEEETTETAEAETVEPEKNWEQIAKDNQASFTRVSQELAELKKQVENSKPKMVQQGKINPEFEQQYGAEVDNREYLAYDNLARQLEPEQRAVVENLLNEARRLYNPANKTAYESKMAQVKDYFRSDLVESIAKEKLALLSQVKTKFQEAIFADKKERAQKVAQSIDAVPELRELVYQDSENYSPEVADIVKNIFDYTGDVDVESTQKAINKIKELGVKEYLAKQKAEQAKAQASVPTGEQVVQKSTDMPTRDEMLANPSLYTKAVKKYGMEKVDAVIMKG